MTIKYFKAAKNTRRFRFNQQVWIVHEYANHMDIVFRWRGKGRYVSGVIDKFSPCVGEIKTIEVVETFIHKIYKTLKEDTP